MRLANRFTVQIQGLHPCMRKAMKVAEDLWVKHGRREGITITSGLDGVHSAASWHYSGCAVDIRHKYWDLDKRKVVYTELKKALPEYDIVLHTTHIHMEPGNDLARKYGILL